MSPWSAIEIVWDDYFENIQYAAVVMVLNITL